MANWLRDTWREVTSGGRAKTETYNGRSSEPRRPAARRVETVEAVTDDILRLVWKGTGAGSVGGMATKLQAAQKAAASGVPMIIGSGREPGTLRRMLAG